MNQTPCRLVYNQHLQRCCSALWHGSCLLDHSRDRLHSICCTRCCFSQYGIKGAHEKKSLLEYCACLRWWFRRECGWIDLRTCWLPLLFNDLANFLHRNHICCRGSHSRCVVAIGILCLFIESDRLRRIVRHVCESSLRVRQESSATGRGCKQIFSDAARLRNPGLKIR